MTERDTKIREALATVGDNIAAMTMTARADVMEQCTRDAFAGVDEALALLATPEPTTAEPIQRLAKAWKEWNGHPEEQREFDELARAIRDLVAHPPAATFPREITMAEVRLHCGELSERESIAVRWVLDRMPKRVTVEQIMEVFHEWDEPAQFGGLPLIPDLRDRLTKLMG